MESIAPTSSTSLVMCCEDCECMPLMCKADSEAWLHSVKRKIIDFEQDNQLIVPGSELSHVACIEVGNKCDVLREIVTCHQKTIEDLSLELEEERSASSSAANETMSMMLRLQKDKAEIQLEFRQFKRYSEERIAHDEHELSAMADLLYKREIAIDYLYTELQSYRHRMKSYGLAYFDVDGEVGGAIAMPRDNNADAFFDVHGEMDAFNYPLLRCNLNETFANVDVEYDVNDIDKYAFGDTPRGWNHLKDLDCRISELEKTQTPDRLDEEFPGLDNVWEKVIVGQSHHHPTHTRRIPSDSPKSFVTTVGETGSDLKLPNGSEIGDDTSDKVCTTDIVDQGIAERKPCYGDIISTPRGLLNGGDIEDPEIKNLYMRLQALEGDRESMRKTLNAIQTDKAQVVLLKEISQHLCKEMPQARRIPENKPTLFRSFSFLSVFTLMASFVFWRTKSGRTKYMFGMSARKCGIADAHR